MIRNGCQFLTVVIKEPTWAAEVQQAYTLMFVYPSPISLVY
jgi:hypothetical protein